MVIFRRFAGHGHLLRGAGYVVVIATFVALTLWGYARHHDGERVRPIVRRPPEPPPAGFDRRLAFANEQEILAPPAFPWSIAVLAQLPRADVTHLKTTVPPAPAGQKSPAGLAETLAAELAHQAPALARPFTLLASPPYLVTPMSVELELELDEDGRVAAAAASGAPGDLNALFAERATAFVFAPETAGATFAATVALTPRCYERLRATRGARPLAGDDYRLLFRSLQFGSYPVYGAFMARAPKLLAGGRTTLAFVVAADGHPGRVTLEPAPEEAAARDDIAAAVAAMFLPARLAGARVEISLGN